MKESVIYQDILAQGEQRGRVEGEQRGELRGRVEGERKGRTEEARSIVTRQLTKRFGTLSISQGLGSADELQARINALEIDSPRRRYANELKLSARIY